jgi:hypothetical protein
MSDPFFDERIRDWYFAAFEPPEEFNDGTLRILVDGSEPFDCDDLIAFINRHGMWAALSSRRTWTVGARRRPVRASRRWPRPSQRCAA